ncbi:Putative transposase [Lactobacillus casei W56] [Lacticaseibacillus rhamnosus]|nr:Putative transposase [Lactobacillus casei W56] [Lacticaseibacillus rhamnosus]
MNKSSLKRKEFLHANSLRQRIQKNIINLYTVSYTHLRAHETREDLVCRLLLEKKKKKKKIKNITISLYMLIQLFS